MSAEIPQNPDRKIQSSVATLVGEEGRRTTEILTLAALGQVSVEDAGPAFDRSDDGTLRLTVDRATFLALGLPVTGRR